MSDEADPFESLAGDIQTKRREIQAAAQRLNASRHTVLNVWQVGIGNVLQNANMKLAGVHIFFGEINLIRAKDQSVGLKYPIHGLPKDASLSVVVNTPHTVEVFIMPEQLKRIVGLRPEFPEKEFSNAVAEVLRNASL